MNSFALTLLDNRGNQHFPHVRQFIGADASGSFGVMAGHVHMIAVLRYGLARFCDSAGEWHYLALPSGVLRFFDNQMTISTVRFFLGGEREQICQMMENEIVKTDSEISSARTTMAEIERSLLLRLAELSKQGVGGLSL